MDEVKIQNMIWSYSLKHLEILRDSLEVELTQEEYEEACDCAATLEVYIQKALKQNNFIPES